MKHWMLCLVLALFLLCGLSEARVAVRGCDVGNLIFTASIDNVDTANCANGAITSSEAPLDIKLTLLEGGHPCPNCGVIEKINAIKNDFKQITGLDGDPFVGSGFALGGVGAWNDNKGVYLGYVNDNDKVLVEYSWPSRNDAEEGFRDFLSLLQI